VVSSLQAFQQKFFTLFSSVPSVPQRKHNTAPLILFRETIAVYSDNHMEGIMPKGRIDKVAALQETEFLCLFGLTNVH
jgi:hypothetical protein